MHCLLLSLLVPLFLSKGSPCLFAQWVQGLYIFRSPQFDAHKKAFESKVSSARFSRSAFEYKAFEYKAIRYSL